MIHTHQTAPTQFVEANGIRFAYRRFGKTGGVPFVYALEDRQLLPESQILQNDGLMPAEHS